MHVAGVLAEISYDPAALTYVKTEIGTLLPTVINEPTQDGGVVTFALFQSQPTGPGVAEPGTIATLTFTTKVKSGSIVKFTQNPPAAALEPPDINALGDALATELKVNSPNPPPPPPPAPNATAPTKPVIRVLCDKAWYGSINWTGEANPQFGYRVEVSQQADFSGEVYQKLVNKTATGMANLLQKDGGQDPAHFAPKNKTTYYVRIGNGKLSPKASFTYDCSAPNPSSTPRPTPSSTPTPSLTRFVCERKCDVKSKLPYYPYNQWTSDDLAACKEPCKSL